MKQTILLAEDEAYIRELYQRQLELAGYSVTAVGNGKDAAAALTTTTYSLLLLDIMMPDMNGIDVLKSINPDKRDKNMKIVMLTNLGQDNVIKEAFKLGAVGYLIKSSLNPYQLTEEVRSFLDGSHT